MKLYHILITAGIILILGAIDASDANAIDFSQLAAQVAQGAVLAGAGGLLYKWSHTKRKPKRKAQIIPIEQLKKIA